MENMFTVFAEPQAPARVLSIEPRLESWNANDDPAQIALNDYVRYARALCNDEFTACEGPLALKLVVKSDPRPRFQGYDLDNYLYPLVVRGFGWDPFYAAFAVKGGQASSIAIGTALAIGDNAFAGWPSAVVETHASTSSGAWKHEVADQIGAQWDSNPAEAVEIHLAFRLAKRRNWASLWKPAIDSLGQILGVDNPSKPFHPRDDRIVALGLHRTIDDTLKSRVQIRIWWRVLAS